ncbi:MAG: CpsD/CapB family tyrosine-protein kinase [Nitrospirae bacterium]|nr:CpsD/CapB family tyrosine-protein kinase [Nitrospirota bacterium]
MVRDSYKIVFNGDILAGHDKVCVVDELAKIFKVEKRKIEAIFCNKPVVIKKEVSYERAKKYKTVLNKAGADCSIIRNAKPSDALNARPSSENNSTLGASPSKIQTGNVSQGSAPVKYAIMFNGDILPGYDRLTVKNGLAKLYMLDVRGIDSVFRGKPIVILREAPYDVAVSHKTLMNKIGADCLICSQDNLKSWFERKEHKKVKSDYKKELKPLSVTSKEEAVNEHYDVAKDEIKVCLSCGFKNNHSVSVCSRCGRPFLFTRLRSNDLLDEDTGSSNKAFSLSKRYPLDNMPSNALFNGDVDGSLKKLFKTDRVMVDTLSRGNGYAVKRDVPYEAAQDIKTMYSRADRDCSIISAKMQLDSTPKEQLMPELLLISTNTLEYPLNGEIPGKVRANELKEELKASLSDMPADKPILNQKTGQNSMVDSKKAVDDKVFLSEKVFSLIKRNEREQANFIGHLTVAKREHGYKKILVTSANNFEGKTTTAINISYSISKATNESVLLVDGNIHKPTIFKLFNTVNTPGLTEYFLGQEDYYASIQATMYNNLTIMPSGLEISNSNDLYDASIFENKLNELKARFNYIIYDSHSVLSYPDTSIIARYFDAIVIVVECEKTKYDVIQQAKDKLESVGGKIWGVVMNKRKFYIPRFLYGKI